MTPSSVKKTRTCPVTKRSWKPSGCGPAPPRPPPSSDLPVHASSQGPQCCPGAAGSASALAGRRPHWLSPGADTHGACTAPGVGGGGVGSPTAFGRFGSERLLTASKNTKVCLRGPNDRPQFLTKVQRTYRIPEKITNMAHGWPQLGRTPRGSSWGNQSEQMGWEKPVSSAQRPPGPGQSR